MTDLRQAAQQALEALKLSVPTTRAGEDEYAEKGWQEHRAAMVALKAALAEPQSTHSNECYKWHHECAVAEVNRLRAALAEPVQEPVMYQWQHSETGRASVVGPFWGPMYLSSTQPEPEERSFCTRCGKRLHAHDIHTCTPPQLWEGEK